MLRFLPLLILIVMPARAPGEIVTYTDKLGRTTSVEAPVRRAVVFQLYEFLPSLKCWNQVVGVGRGAFDKGLMLTSVPGLANRVHSVGGGNDINVEGLLKLNPDVVLTWTYRPENTRFMEQKGLKAIAVYPDSFSEMFDVIRLMGRLFGRPEEARALLGRMNGILDMVKDRGARVPPDKRAKVLWLYSRQNSVGAGNSLSNDIITTIGAVNAAGAAGQRTVDASIETIIAWNPDVIFVWGNAKYSAREVLANPQWRFVKAVRDKRVFKAPEWSTWSPCLAPIVLWMATKTYPDLYRDVNLHSTSDRFFRDVFGVPLPASGRNDF
jgi:iron complex transport system substrate-binding protein